MFSFRLLRRLAPALLLGGSLPATAAVWTVDQAVATARQHSPDAQLARERIAGAEALVDQAQSAWQPQLSLQGRYTDTNSPMMAFGSILNQRAFSFALDFNHPGRIDDLNASGTLAYNLYSGGRATAQRAAARAGVQAATQDLQAAQQQLVAEVVKAILNLRKARETVVALDAGVQAYAAAVAVAQARFDTGRLLKADLLSLEVQLAQARVSLLAARHAASLAEQTFYFLLGLDPTTEPVELAEPDPALQRLTLPATNDFSARPELLGLQQRLQAAEAQVAAAKGGHKPAVNAFATYQYDQGWELDRHADSWLAGVAVDVNVFDGGATRARIRQRAAKFDQAKTLLRKVTLGIGLEVQQARDNHANACERLVVSAQAVAQAGESAALTRARFEQGAVLTADLIGAETRLIEARLRHTLAVADERSALVELRRAVGLPPVDPP
ncbi:MAG: TolC family protein [Opitutales bacterium]